MRKPKARMCLLLLATSLLLSGCWDRTEVNDLSISIAAALDLENGKQVRFSEQVALPGNMGGGQTGGAMTGGSGNKSFFTFSALGSDMREAMQNFQTQMSRRLFTAHRRIFLIGEDVAKKGIKPYLDEVSRDPEGRLRTSVAMTKGKALDYLQAEYPLERVPAEGLRKTLFGETGREFDMDFKQLMIMLSTPGTDAFLPIVKMEPPTPGSKPKFKVDGLAVLHDGKLAGTLTGDQAKGVMWMRGQLRRDSISVSLPGYEGHLNFELLRSRNKVRARMVNGHPAIEADFIPEGDLYENETKLDVGDPKNLALVEKALSAQIQKGIMETLDILQHEDHSDIVRFGDRVHVAYPQEWKKLVPHWDDEFSKMPVTLHVTAHIRHTGMVGASSIQEKEVRR